jgi:hypothetical protein
MKTQLGYCLFFVPPRVLARAVPLVPETTLGPTRAPSRRVLWTYRHRVHRTALKDLVRDLGICDCLECFHQFDHARAIASNPGRCEQLLHRFYVSLGQVDDVDVVLDARAIGDVVVPAKYAQVFADFQGPPGARTA